MCSTANWESFRKHPVTVVFLKHESEHDFFVYVLPWPLVNTVKSKFLSIALEGPQNLVILQLVSSLTVFSACSVLGATPLIYFLPLDPHSYSTYSSVT